MKLRYNPFLALLAIAPVAPAADYYFDVNGATAGLGGTGNWSGALVWRNGSTTGTLGPWVDGNTARFSATSIVTLDQNASATGVNFGAINCELRPSGANTLTFSGGTITNSAPTSGHNGHDLTGLLGGSVIFNPVNGNLGNVANFFVKADNTSLTSVELLATAAANHLIIDHPGAFGSAGTDVKLTVGTVNIGALATEDIAGTDNGTGGNLSLNAWDTELAGGTIRTRVGNNTWNGPVNVTANSGLITRGAAGVKLTLTGDINLNGNTLTLSPTSGADGIVLSGNISGSGGGITQANSALGGAGSAGTTSTSTISGTNTYTGPTQINVGRLNLTGSLTSDLTMGNGTHLLGEGSTTGALVFGTTNEFFLDPNTPATHFEAGSINASAGPVAIKLTGPSPVVTNMVVMESATPIVGGLSNFSFTGRGSLSFDGTGTQLLFTYTPATLIWEGDQANPTFWDGSTTNWLNGGSPDAFQPNDLVVFNDDAASFTVAVQGTSVEPGSVTFANATNDYTLGGSPIAGSGTFTKNGAAKVTITTNNTFTGLATINAGTVALGDGTGITGSLGTNPALTNNAALETNFNAARVLDQVIGGTGSFTQKGVGAVTLSADNTYSGGTTIDAGATLQIGNGSLFGSVVGDIVTNGTLTFNRGDGGTFANNISGSGGISKAANTGATATLTGNNTFDGDVVITTNGSLAAGSATALGSTVGETTINAAGGRLELLDGITITGETINIFGGGATFNGALMAQGNATATWAGPVVLSSSDARLGAAAGGTLIVTGDISDGVGTALNIGAGTGGSAIVRIAGGLKTYTGGTNIIRGVLQLGASDILPSGTTLDVDTANAAENATFDLNGFNQTVAGLNRSNVPSGGTSGTGTAFVTNTSGTPSTFTVNQSVSTTYAGRTTGNLSLIQSGTGTLTLSGPQVDHLGNTTVNGAITIAAGSQITLTPTANNTTNSIGGNGTLTLDGKLIVNLAGTDATHGNTWNLIDTGALTEIYNETTFSVDSSLGAFSELVATPGTWKLVNGINEWTFVESSGVLSVGPISDPFTPWIDSFFPGETNAAIIGKTADPDNDGVDNVTEFALNGNPNDGSNNGLTALVLQDTTAPAGNELTLVAAVRDSAVFAAAGTTQTATIDGVVYTIEGSLALTFPDSAVSTVGTAIETTPAGTTLPDITGSAWEYRTFKLDASEGLPGKGFLRAKIEVAP